MSCERRFWKPRIGSISQGTRFLNTEPEVLLVASIESIDSVNGLQLQIRRGGREESVSDDTSIIPRKREYAVVIWLC